MIGKAGYDGVLQQAMYGLMHLLIYGCYLGNAIGDEMHLFLWYFTFECSKSHNTLKCCTYIVKITAF